MRRVREGVNKHPIIVTIVFILSVLFMVYSYSNAIYDIPNNYGVVFPAEPTYKIDWSNVTTLPMRVSIDNRVPAGMDYALEYIYHDPYGEYASKSVVLIAISSYGGYVGDSLATYDIILKWRERYKTINKRIYTYVEGYGCSGGSLILMAGEKRFVSRSGRIMIHKPYLPNKPSIFQFRLRKAVRNDLDRVDALMRGIYLEACGNMKVVNDFDTGKDIWYTPEQALKDGVVNGII